MVDDPNRVNVTGTLIWYFFVCQREVWLMTHQINPDEDDANMDLGRFIHETSYTRYSKKEIHIGHVKLDIVRFDHGVPIIGEVKKSSKHFRSARMQLGYYLLELKRRGIEAQGELRVPKEKKTEEVMLTEILEQELEDAETEIRALAITTVPPLPKKVGLCKTCAYQELCWS